MNKNNKWVFNNNVGLKGGGKDELNKWMKEHVKEYSSIPEKNAEAIRRYTSGKYRLYNEKLRAGRMTKNIMESLKEVVDSMRALPDYSGEVYRGSVMSKSVLKEIKVGDVIFDPAFLSTSVDKPAALKFLTSSSTSKDNIKYLMTIDAKRGKSLMDRGLSSFAVEEAEVLLLPKTPREVTKIEYKGPDVYIYGKEVDAIGQSARNIFTGEVKVIDEAPGTVK